MQDPQLMVHDAHIEVDGTSYYYSSGNEDTVVVLGREEEASMNFSVTSTIVEDYNSSNYVLIALPTTSSSLSSANEFTVGITGITIDGTKIYGTDSGQLSTNEDGMTIAAGFLALDDSATVTAATAATLFADASSSYSSESSYNVMILEIEDQKAYSTFEVSVDFTMPDDVTTSTQYVALEGMSVYTFATTGSQKVFNSATDGNSMIKMAYENPEWDVDFIGLTTNVNGYINGSVSLNMGTEEVLHNTSVYTDQYDGDETVTIITAPSITGYTFIGWSYNGKVYSANSVFEMGASHATLTAQWSTNKYTISYVDNDDDSTTLMSDSTVEYNSTITLSSPDDKSGYTFKEWSLGDEVYASGEDNTTNASYTMGASDVTLTATWETKKYTVSYETGDGDAIARETYSYGETITLSTPEYEGHIFLHWTDDTEDEDEYIAGVSYTIPAGDTTFTAVWKIHEHEVFFVDDDGDSYTTYFLEDVDYGESIILPTPTKEGYKFLYWNYNGKTYEAGEEFTMDAEEDITFTASWEINEYTITFDIEGDAFVDIEADYNKAVTLPTDIPTKEGYTFLYWEDDELNKYENSGIYLIMMIVALGGIILIKRKKVTE